MAKYSESDISNFASQDPKSLTGYQRRLVRGQLAGVSRAQARGHARYKLKEQPISFIKKQQQPVKPVAVKPPKPVKPPQPPKIMKQVRRMPGGKMVSTYSTTKVVSQASAQVRTAAGVKQARIYFQVWNKQTGKFQEVYMGKRSVAHGITAEEFLRRVDLALASGNAKDLDAAVRSVIHSDSVGGSGGGGGAGVDSPGGEEVPEDFSQIRMYVINK